MAQTDGFIQSSYDRTLKQMVAGQIANTLPSKCESGRFDDTGADGDSLPFGYACQWTGENVVQRSVGRKSIGTTGTGSTNTSLVINLVPSQPRPSVGSVLYVHSSNGSSRGSATITAVGNNDAFTMGSGLTGVTAGDVVTLRDGGLTTFAGVAVKNVALPGDNSPVDTYNSNDIVTVGSEGDYVVVCKDAVSRGDSVSVYVGNTAADKGQFSNDSEASGNYIGIPGAVFMTDRNSDNLAVVRLTKQSS